jgi:hypothetical protein
LNELLWSMDVNGHNICYRWELRLLHNKCVSSKEKVEKPIPMQIEQVRNWLVLQMVFAWDHLILSSHIYPRLSLQFHSGFWLKFSLHIGPVVCVYSLRLYSLLESFISGWKRSRYSASPGIVLDITLPAIFQRECRPCCQWSKSERMFVWNSCLSACKLYPGLAVNAI